MREPLGDFLGVLDQFRSLGVPVPAFDETVRDLLNKVNLDNYDDAMLTEYDEFGNSRELETVTSLALVKIAGCFGWTLAHAHWRLGRLIPIGVRLDYPADVDYPQEIVHWYDLQALTVYFDGQSPFISGKIDWAYLEKAAEEIFDCLPEQIPENVVFLRDRLKIYASLFELELPEETADAVE